MQDSYFPILVLYTESNEKIVVSDPKYLRDGTRFRVLSTNYPTNPSKNFDVKGEIKLLS